MKRSKSYNNGVSATTAQKFVDRLLTEGQNVDWNETNSDEPELPPFYDEELFKKGQQVFWKYLFAMFAAKFYGLLAILASPNVLQILMMTQKSSTDYSAYVRYMSTIFHMMVWYKEDFKPGSKSWKSISEVSKKHGAASQKCGREGIKKISQKDMAITQFGFMGFQIARGELIGIHNPTEEELKGFIHLWRVVGHILGIDDRFNICRESVEETKEICSTLIDTYLYPEIKERNPDYLKMSEHLTRGLWCMNPALIYKVIMNYLYLLLQKPEDRNNNNNKKRPKDPFFKLDFLLTLHYYFLFISFYLHKFNIVRHFFNALHHLDLWFMRNWPILTYSRFGKLSYVKIKI